jgi:hypothetical protein
MKSIYSKLILLGLISVLHSAPSAADTPNEVYKKIDAACFALPKIEAQLEEEAVPLIINIQSPVSRDAYARNLRAKRELKELLDTCMLMYAKAAKNAALDSRCMPLPEKQLRLESEAVGLIIRINNSRTQYTDKLIEKRTNLAAISACLQDYSTAAHESLKGVSMPQDVQEAPSPNALPSQ